MYICFGSRLNNLNDTDLNGIGIREICLRLVPVEYEHGSSVERLARLKNVALLALLVDVSC